MILSKQLLEYFKKIQSKVTQAMAFSNTKTPYWIEDDEIILRYEAIRDVWFNRKSVKSICQKHTLNRSYYYEVEKRFEQFGTIGLFSTFAHIKQFPKLEQFVVMIKQCRPSLSNTALLRMAQAVPVTSRDVTKELISEILNSHGLNISRLTTDEQFYGRVQRTLMECNRLRENPIGIRDTNNRKESFFIDEDPYHKRLELLRELFFYPQSKPKELCAQYGISQPGYYRLVNDYKLYGPWAVISAPSHGNQGSISGETELRIILEKLRHPQLSSQSIVDVLNLKCSRFVVNRVLMNWKLLDDNLKPVALDEYISEGSSLGECAFEAPKSAYQMIPDKTLLETRRINRNFDLICKKMNTNTYHICDPGPLLLAPFLNDFGIIQAFETYGPTKLRGKELTNLPLLNVMRILAGYPRVNHLSDNRDRSVAFASGIGLFGTRSKFYDNTIEFKFDDLHKLRCDLVTRAIELGVISGKSIGFDFHFKEFFGSSAKEKGIGIGPDKSGQLVPGFRPHIAWDLAENVIITMAYYQGATRSPRILKSFCERDLFIVLNRLQIEEIYMDSEYTKEADFHYLKKTCKNGDIYVCLKQNPQIKKLIRPALEDSSGWELHDEIDEKKTITVILPKTGLKMKIIILRNSNSREEIRCFGTTNIDQIGDDILRKYPHRWTIENGIKDLVKSYFVDEIFGHDPEKVEFEFYCVMAARLAYEYFLKTLGGSHHRKEDGNKTTLSTMRQLLFEKRNCTIGQNSDGNLVLTFLDCGNDLEKKLVKMYEALTKEKKNKVLWWGNRSLIPEFKNQYKVSD